MRIAFVRAVIRSSMRATSIWYVSGSTSTSTGTMPDCTIGAMSVENVSTDVMISSPGSQWSRSRARRNADEPELTIPPCCFESSAAGGAVSR